MKCDGSQHKKSKKRFGSALTYRYCSKCGQIFCNACEPFNKQHCTACSANKERSTSDASNEKEAS